MFVLNSNVSMGKMLTKREKRLQRERIYNNQKFATIHLNFGLKH